MKCLASNSLLIINTQSGSTVKHIEKISMKININPDREFVNDMRKALKDNNGFCPCSPRKERGYKVYVQGIQRDGKWNLPLRSLHKTDGIKR